MADLHVGGESAADHNSNSPHSSDLDDDIQIIESGENSHQDQSDVSPEKNEDESGGQQNCDQAMEDAGPSENKRAKLDNDIKCGKNEDKLLNETNGVDYGTQFEKDVNRMNVLIGVTGSVATIKIHELVSQIYRNAPDNKVNIRIVTTKCGTHFFSPDEFGFPVYTDDHEWNMWKERGDPVLHIELRKWADLLLIAPLDANTMAKIANGMCDNLLTCVTRAWDIAKPVYFCPAMNTYMYEHPLTFKHMEILTGLLQFKEIPTVEKELMCGDKGYGAMAPVQIISSVVVGEIKKKFALITDCSRFPLAYELEDD